MEISNMNVLCDAAGLILDEKDVAAAGSDDYNALFWQESPKTLNKSMEDLFNGVQQVYDNTKRDKKYVHTPSFTASDEKKKSILIDDSLFLSSPPIINEVDEKDNDVFNFEMLSNMPCPPSVSNVIPYSPEIETPLEEVLRTIESSATAKDADAVDKTRTIESSATAKDADAVNKTIELADDCLSQYAHQQNIIHNLLLKTHWQYTQNVLMQLTALLSVREMTVQEKGYDLLDNVLKCMHGVHEVGSTLIRMSKEKEEATRVEGGSTVSSSSPSSLSSKKNNLAPPPPPSTHVLVTKKRKHVSVDTQKNKESLKPVKRKKISITNHSEHSFQAFVVLQTDAHLNFGRKLQFDSHQHFKKFCNKVSRTDKERFNKINDFIITYGLPRLSKYQELQNGLCTASQFKDYCKKQNEEIINHSTKV